MERQRSNEGRRSAASLAWLTALLLLAPTSSEGGNRPAARPSREQLRNGSITSRRRSPRSIRLNFRNVDFGKVLQYLSMAAGKTLLIDPGLSGPVTILNPRPIPLREALRVVQSVLQRRGYRLEQDPLLWRVVPLRPAATASVGSSPSPRPEATGRPAQLLADGPASASRAAANGENGRRGERAPRVMVFKRAAASAPQVARIINELFRPRALGGGARAQRSGAQRADQGNRRGNRSRSSAPAAVPAGPQVRASADPYTNSVVVVAPALIAGEMRRLVEQLDQKVPPNVTSRVFHLRYATAEALAPVVSRVLLGTAPASAAGGALQNVPLQRRARMAARLGNSRTAAGPVLPDTRTNSLVVMATAESFALVEKLLRQLDAPVHPPSTALVVPLQNARATDLGLLLNQAFSSTSRGYGSGSGGRNSARSTASQRRSGAGSRTNRSSRPR